MIGHRLNRELTVYRSTYVTDPVGGRTYTLNAVGTIRVQISQPSAQERTIAAQVGANLSHVLHTLYGADVERGDLLDGDLPSEVEAGSRLRVVSVVSNSRDTYLRLECEVTQGE